MSLEDLMNAVKALSVEERRKLAVYILELEKNHLKETLGPQIDEDLKSVSQALQDAVEKIKKAVKENL
jgi:hypothetical protein